MECDAPSAAAAAEPVATMVPAQDAMPAAIPLLRHEEPSSAAGEGEGEADKREDVAAQAPPQDEQAQAPAATVVTEEPTQQFDEIKLHNALESILEGLKLVDNVPQTRQQLTEVLAANTLFPLAYVNPSCVACPPCP